MAEVVIDTDVVIDHLRGAHRLQPRRDRFAYSVVTRAELFAGRSVDGTACDSSSRLFESSESTAG